MDSVAIFVMSVFCERPSIIQNWANYKLDFNKIFYVIWHQKF